MLFNSVNYAIFFIIVFILYWFVINKSLRVQNFLLLSASYFFYACWDWRFLFLLVFSTFLDYFTGLKISKANHKHTRRIWLWISIIINVGFLGLFKYYNFFVDSISQTLTYFGAPTNFWTLKIILPVGISFYTFHGLSYVIDIYNKRINAERDFIDYSLFVSFFPLLVAGPIERATHLLPQLKVKRVFNYLQGTDGLKQILWGLFKKVVIADNCAKFVNIIFENSNEYPSSILALGAIFFAFQIYGDFSGYSDIALGSAKLLGINLLRNFNYPYFSRDIAEFWRRWHISLSSWFKDYLYIPLGGSKGSIWLRIRNTFIIFLVSGFWHGANWTFMVWGLLHAIYILPSIIFNTNRSNIEVVAKGKLLPTIKEVLSICFTFGLTTFAWIFFRAESLSQAFNYIFNMFTISIWNRAYSSETGLVIPSTLFILLFIFIVIEWLGREHEYATAVFNKGKRLYRLSLYYFLILLIFVYAGSNQQFIYFQF